MKKTLIHNTNFKRATTLMLSCMLCLTLFMTLSMNVAFCDEGGDPFAQITDAVTTSSENIYNLIRTVVSPIAAVLFAYAGLQFLLGGKGGTEAARKIFWNGVAAILIVAFAPMIANVVANIGKNFGWSMLENPLAN